MFMTSRAAASFRSGKPGSPSIAKPLVPKTPKTWVVRPAQQVREISFVVNPTLFKKVPSGELFSQEYTVVPGHIHGELNAAEIQQVGKLKDGLSPAFWTQVMQTLETVQAGQPASLGHAPDKKSLTVHRGWPVAGSFGTDYLNLDLSAASWSEPYASGKDAFTIDIGTLDEGAMLALFKTMQQQPAVYSLNCGRFTWVALLASKAPCTDGLGYSAAMDLADVADAMYRAGVLVDTDYAVVELMRKAGFYKDPKTTLVQRDAFSFLALAFGWSLATNLQNPTVIPAPIRRIAVPNQADLEKTFTGMWKRLDDMAKRNIDSFLVEGHAAPAALPAMPPPGPMRQITSEADWADVEAHVNALSDEDRSRRFISANAKEVMTYLRRMKTHSFYALRDPKTHAIMLLLQIELQAPAGSTVLRAEVGTSVIPSERNKKLGLWGVQWACAWARNRGARLLVGQHAAANTAVEKVLPVLGTVRYVGEEKGYRAFEVPLPEPDSESHWLEAFAPAGQSNRQPTAPAKK